MQTKFTISLIVVLGLVFGISTYAYDSLQSYREYRGETLGAAPVLRVNQGGTGAASFTAGECLVGAGTDAITTAPCGGGGGSGTVTSVGLTASSSFSVYGSPITTSGTFGLGLASGYIIPLTASTTEWATAYGWGNHAGLYDILGQATSTLSSHTTTYNHANYDTAYGWGDHSVAGYWNFASTTLDYWFDNTAGITRLNPYMTQAYASSTFYTKLEIDAFGYLTQAYASSTFLTITDAQAGYDVKGQATSTLASHTGTYNHDNFNTAYGWGNHALAGYNLQAFASSTYAIAGGAFHDGFSDFVANEHIDWTGASAGTIHATNYVDNNTNASTICSGTTTYLDGEGNCDDISGVYLGQSTFYATTSINHITDLPALNTYPAFSIASSTWMSIAGLTASSTIQLKPAYTAETWAGIRCATDAGTALIKVGDGTNWQPAFTASSTAGLITVSSNNTFTAGEVIKAVVSNIDSSVNWISCSISKKNQ